MNVDTAYLVGRIAGYVAIVSWFAAVIVLALSIQIRSGK